MQFTVQLKNISNHLWPFSFITVFPPSATQQQPKCLVDHNSAHHAYFANIVITTTGTKDREAINL